MGFFGHSDVDELIRSKDIAGLVKCLTNSDATEQFRAAEALARFGNWKGFAFLILSLRNKKSSIRGAAAETLGSLQDPRAVPALSKVLRDEDTDVQQAAVEALHTINTSEAMDAITRMDLTRSTHNEEQKSGHEPNQSFNDAIFGGGSQVEDRSAGVSSAEMQHAAEQHFILASKYFEEDRFTQSLTEANFTLELSPRWSEASNLKGLILEELGEHYQALVAYKKAIYLDTNSTDARENLANLIAVLDIPSTPMQDLLDGLNSEEWDMRRDAVAALSIKDEPEALQAIIRALYDEDLEVRAIALEALECSPEPEAVNAVQRYYDEFVGEESEGEQPAVAVQNKFHLLSDESEPAELPIVIPDHRSIRDYITTASNLIDEGEYSRAYIQCQLALFGDTYNSDAWNMLGIIHEEDEAYRQAYFCYKMAVSCDPSFEEARSNLDDIVREYGGENANVRTLLSDLETGEDDLIYDAVVNLGELNDPDAIEPLLTVLNHPRRKIVLAAIQSLGNLHATQAAEIMDSIYAELWYFPVSPEKMTLDQIERSLNQCITDWADRCKIILALGKLGESAWLIRSVEREFTRLKQLSQSFYLVGIDDINTIYQVTLDLAVDIFEKNIERKKLEILRSEIMASETEGSTGINATKVSELSAILDKIITK